MIKSRTPIRVAMVLAGAGIAVCPAAWAQSARQERDAMTHNAPGVAGARDAQDDARKVRRLRDMMSDELNLDEEQQEPINAIFEEHIERLLSARMERDGADDRAAVIAEIRQDLEEARERQDREAVVELMRELRETARGNKVDFSMHAAFRDEVVAELYEEQVEKFLFMFEHLFGAGQAGGESAPLGARQQTHFMWRALFQVGLDQDQRETIREMFNEYHGNTMRQAAADEEGQTDPELDMDRVAELRERVMDLLTDEQIAQFEEIEADMIKNKRSLENIAYDRANDRPTPGGEPERFRVKQQRVSPNDDFDDEDDWEDGDIEDSDEDWTEGDPN